MSSLKRTFVLTLLVSFFATFFLIVWMVDRGAPSDAYKYLTDVGRDNKIVVMGRLEKEDTDWVEEELDDWRSAIYHVENTSYALHTSVNKGRETLPYLTYIIDNYDDLPAVIAFIHPHKDGYPAAWHTDAKGNSNANAMQSLRTGVVVEKGYVNLRCNGKPGCPEWIKPFRAGSQPDGEQHMQEVWETLFKDEAATMPVPAALAAPCCAQFAVSNERVWRRPREDYIRYRDWVLDTTLSDETVGRIFEYLWHVIFGQNAVDCPDYRKCQCDTYGRFCR